MKKQIKKILGPLYMPLRKLVLQMSHGLSLFCYYITGKYFSNLKRLKKLKNIYQGKRCFVICNGPSLRAEDLTKIYEHGDISIGMNGIPRIYDKTPWRPSVLSAADEVAFDESNKQMIKNCEADIKLYDCTRYLKSLGAKGNRIYLRFDESPALLDKPRFAYDATKKLPAIGTSVYFLIEFALYLGCNEVYLLGCDMSYAVNIHRDGTITYNDSGKGHFYSANQNKESLKDVEPCPIWEMEIAYEYLAKYERQHNIKVYNATRGGKLEYFQRVDFDSLFT